MRKGYNKMDIKSVFSLMDKAESSSFNRIEIEIGDIKLRLDRSAAQAPVVAPTKETQEKPEPKQDKKQNEDDLILSPISGVFYAAKSPEEPAFVSAGSKVSKGDTVCIIEAMKTMNEITAPKSGVIESIMVSDSEPVSADQPLFMYAGE